MARPVTLFTGQWADLPLEELAPLAKEMGYDGLELACWGDHLDVSKGAQDKAYCDGQKKILEDNGLQLFAISNHLVGQAICDNIDERHQAILPEHVWGNGDPDAWADLGAVGPASTLNMETSAVVQVADAAERE